MDAQIGKMFQCAQSMRDKSTLSESFSLIVVAAFGHFGNDYEIIILSFMSIGRILKEPGVLVV